MTSQTMNVLANEIWNERLRQDEKWGGAEHDDRHTPRQWCDLIEAHAKWAWMKSDYKDWQNYRKRLVEIAALATAAVEALDRNMAAARI